MTSLLNLLDVETKFHVDLAKQIAEISEGNGLTAEAIFDRIHDWRRHRSAACDAAMELVYDDLFMMVAEASATNLNRHTFIKHQAARRRRRQNGAA